MFLLIPMIYILPLIWKSNQETAVFLAEPISDCIAAATYGDHVFAPVPEKAVCPKGASGRKKEEIMSEQKKDTRTEFEKLKAGELFWNSDPEILAVKSRARALADSYNRTTEDQPEERLRILKELFGIAMMIFLSSRRFTAITGSISMWGKNFLPILPV